MKSQDIRWEQRFANYNRALSKLTDAVKNTALAQFSDLEKEGIIQRFEYTHELAWNVMKDYLEYQGNSSIGGSRDATREAFKINLLKDGEAWMDMIKSRNQTTHTYNEETAEEIFEKIVSNYYSFFVSFQQKMESLRSGSQADIFSQDI